MPTAISIRARENFCQLLGTKLDAIPVQNQRDARVAAAALQAILDKTPEPQLPQTLKNKIDDIKALVEDPLSLGNPNLYQPGALPEYQQLARERIPRKIQELLHLPSNALSDKQKQRLKQSDVLNTLIHDILPKFSSVYDSLQKKVHSLDQAIDTIGNELTTQGTVQLTPAMSTELQTLGIQLPPDPHLDRAQGEAFLHLLQTTRETLSAKSKEASNTLDSLSKMIGEMISKINSIIEKMASAIRGQ